MSKQLENWTKFQLEDVLAESMLANNFTEPTPI